MQGPYAAPIERGRERGTCTTDRACPLPTFGRPTRRSADRRADRNVGTEPGGNGLLWPRRSGGPRQGPIERKRGADEIVVGRTPKRRDGGPRKEPESTFLWGRRTAKSAFHMPARRRPPLKAKILTPSEVSGNPRKSGPSDELLHRPAPTKNEKCRFCHFGALTPKRVRHITRPSLRRRGGNEPVTEASH